MVVAPMVIMVVVTVAVLVIAVPVIAVVMIVMVVCVCHGSRSFEANSPYHAGGVAAKTHLSRNRVM